MKEKGKLRKELIVSAIENGTVIDHIATNSVHKVIKILGLDDCENQILFGTNLDSKKYGKKGIIKVRDTFFKSRDINKIALVAPTATLIIIKNFEVTEKKHVKIPDSVLGIAKCFNPNCISNHEQIITRFKVIDKTDLKLLCHYCEKITAKNNITFI